MREEETFDNLIPHFDDEQTVLAARPVVPLKQLNAKLKYKRRWFLGGAFALAMLLGAASALLAAYVKLRQVPEPEITSSSVSEESLTSELPPAPIVEEEEPVIHKQPVIKPVTQRRTTPTIRNTDRTEPVMVEEWQERRARRVEQREERREQRRERRRAQHNDRDLSNLDEIFEGPRKP